jgi:threonine dehydrogenase-like Zn-dependent dehydrogenase
VIVVELADSRLQRLPLSDPAIMPVNPRREDVGAAVRQATRGRMADLAFEVTGEPEVVRDGLAVLRRQGRLVVLSSPRGGAYVDFHDLCNAPSYTIIGAHNSSTPPDETDGTPWTWQRHTELFFDLLASGEVSVEPLISHCEPYREAPGLYQMLLADRSPAMGVILDWTQ